MCSLVDFEIGVGAKIGGFNVTLWPGLTCVISRPGCMDYACM